MKTLILALFVAFTASTAHAEEITQEQDLMCGKEARALVQTHTKAPHSAIEFWHGVIVGDGAAALEIALYRVQVGESEQIYKLDFYMDGCDKPLNFDRLD